MQWNSCKSAKNKLNSRFLLNLVKFSFTNFAANLDPPRISIMPLLVVFSQLIFLIIFFSFFRWKSNANTFKTWFAIFASNGTCGTSGTTIKSTTCWTSILFTTVSWLLISAVIGVTRREKLWKLWTWIATGGLTGKNSWFFSSGLVMPIRRLRPLDNYWTLPSSKDCCLQCKMSLSVQSMKRINTTCKIQLLFIFP